MAAYLLRKLWTMRWRHSDHTDHDVETGQAEAGDAAVPQEEGCESAEPEAAQGEVLMSDSAAEVDASDDAQDAQKGGPGDPVSGQAGGSSQETKELPREENKQRGNEPQKEALGDAQPMPRAEE